MEGYIWVSMLEMLDNMNCHMVTQHWLRSYAYGKTDDSSAVINLQDTIGEEPNT